MDAVRQFIFVFAVTGLSLCLTALALRAMASFLMTAVRFVGTGLGRIGLAVFGVFALACTILAQKPNGGSQTVGAAPASYVGVDVPSGGSCDWHPESLVSTLTYPLDFAPRGLSVFAFAQDEDEFAFGWAWPLGGRLSDSVRLYARTSLDAGRWFCFREVYLGNAQSNCVMAVSRQEPLSAARMSPSDPPPDACFFALAWSLDTDGDGIIDWDEEHIYRTDPNCADTDGDGLDDGDEIFAFHTNPLDPDSDGDGLTDADDMSPWESDGDFSGQGGGWVEQNFPNADEILSVGYENWIDRQVGCGLTNGLYKFTVTLPENPSQRSVLTVGDKKVVVTSAGSYSFLLRKWEEYEFGIVPYISSASYSWCDDVGGLAPEAPGGMRRSGPRPSAPVSGLYAEVACEMDGAEEEHVIYPTEANRFGRILLTSRIKLSSENEIITDFTSPQSFLAECEDITVGTQVCPRWTSADGTLLGEGSLLLLSAGIGDIRRIDVDLRCGGAVRHGTVWISPRVDETTVVLGGAGEIVFEDAYTNAPNEVVEASSTRKEITVSCLAKGSGTLTLASSCGPTLVLEDERGEEISLPRSWSVAAAEPTSVRYRASVSDGSRTGRLGDLTLTYESDDGSDRQEQTLSVSAYTIKVEAVATWPENRVRHVFGPGEEYRCIVTPGTTVRGQVSFETGLQAIGYTIDHRENILHVQVIPPSDFCRELLREMTADDWRDANQNPLDDAEVGVGMATRLQVLPEYVSFRNICLSEGTSVMYLRSGCFLDTTKYPSSQYAHGNAQGANRSDMCIGDENRIEGLDFVGCRLGVPPSSEGGFSLNIPVRWGVSGSSVNLLRFSAQHFSVTSEGESTITRDGCSMTRSLSL